VVLRHPLRLAICLVFGILPSTETGHLSGIRGQFSSFCGVCVLDLPFARLCHIFFMLTVLSTVVRVTECIVKGFCSPALHRHIQVENRNTALLVLL
jgi:hypothetical protein